MDKLVAELRALAKDNYRTWQQTAISQAADEIEELLATLERMADYASLDWHQFYRPADSATDQ